jgi:hypothetical protein
VSNTKAPGASAGARRDDGRRRGGYLERLIAGSGDLVAQRARAPRRRLGRPSVWEADAPSVPLTPGSLTDRRERAAKPLPQPGPEAAPAVRALPERREAERLPSPREQPPAQGARPSTNTMTAAGDPATAAPMSHIGPTSPVAPASVSALPDRGSFSAADTGPVRTAEPVDAAHRQRPRRGEVEPTRSTPAARRAPTDAEQPRMQQPAALARPRRDLDAQRIARLQRLREPNRPLIEIGTVEVVVAAPPQPLPAPPTRIPQPIPPAAGVPAGPALPISRRAPIFGLAQG